MEHLQIALFGARSPLVVEYEETCIRRGLTIRAAISVSGTPRVQDMSTVMSLDELTDDVLQTPFLPVAFAPKRRAEHHDAALKLGMTPAEALVDPTSVLPRSLRIGAGSFINAAAVVGAVTRIGRGVLVNRAVSIGHHCVIGDFVSIGPGATLAGNIRVGQGTMIGAGSVILPDVRIGENCVIAAGSLVRKHVADGAFVAGNPAEVRQFDAGRSSLHLEGGE